MGTKNAELLDAGTNDEDVDVATPAMFDEENGDEESAVTAPMEAGRLVSEDDFRSYADKVYAQYAGPYKSRFKWLRPTLFIDGLQNDLLSDARKLIDVLARCGTWDPGKDSKLNVLETLVTRDHPDEKVLVFTQFADTVRYLTKHLKDRGLTALEGVTGDSADPTGLAWRFSPVSNEKRDRVTPQDELRVLVATDVLSEGQNLQDAAIVVNYDLPWAIIRLTQRAGRVDRIGQKGERILCYSFLPAEGIERIINLRKRVRQRLRENAEVLGTDEAFFEDDTGDQPIVDLYNEKAGILDGDDDTEVDLASYAYQIWKNATSANPALQKTIAELPDVVYSTRRHTPRPGQPAGVLVYVRTADGNDSLAWVDENGHSVAQSQLRILQIAECAPNTPAVPRHARHHELVRLGVEQMVKDEKLVGGQLGRPSGARFRTYERLKRYAASVKGTLFESQELLNAIDEIYKYPLRQSATDALNRQLKAGASDETLAELVRALHDDDRLCLVNEEDEAPEPRIICSLGLFPSSGGS